MMSDQCGKCFERAGERRMVGTCKIHGGQVCSDCGQDSAQGWRCKSHKGCAPLVMGVYRTPFPERTPHYNGYVYVDPKRQAWHVGAQYNGWFDMATMQEYDGPAGLEPMLPPIRQTTLMNSILPPGDHVCECEVAQGTHGGCRIVPCDKDVREGRALPVLREQYAIREARFGQ